MHRLLGWALAPILLAMAGTAAAASLDIRNAALRVVVIPEARSDVSVTVLKANRRLPLKVWNGLSGQVIVDGGKVFSLFGPPIWCDADAAGAGVHVWGVGRIAYADLPQIVVRVPLDAQVSAGGGVFGAVSAANRLDLAVGGCGDWAVGNVRERRRFEWRNGSRRRGGGFLRPLDLLCNRIGCAGRVRRLFRRDGQPSVSDA